MSELTTLTKLVVHEQAASVTPALKPINFTRGVPATESFPIEDVMDAAVAALKQHGTTMLQYGPATGFTPFREWLAEWQGVEVDQVLTGNGSLQLIDFLCLRLLRPGDTVFTESPTYDRTLTLLRRRQAKIVGIPLEADGPDIAALEARLKAGAPKFFYLSPDFQNPSGVTCSGEKRRHIVELAEQYDFLLLEDAPYRPLRYRGQDEPTLFQLAPQHTVHMSSLSKLVGPGPRLGFLVANAELVIQLAKVAEDTYISPNFLAHGIAYEWCRRGLLGPQIERLKALYAPRLDACLAALDQHMPDTQATRPDGGFFLSVTLPEGVETRAVRAAAAKHQLNLADGLAFFPNGGGERFLRLPYCGLTPEEIEEGIKRLSETVKELS
ncbi:MAG TPA: PLP-dependent aminotransferase family protein [Anaerolineae bacterium]|nr:PLP-dependent aminotransferase family protein [Anaerolineae bacterium]